MKQKGKIWYNEKGEQVPVRYLDQYSQACERGSQKVLDVAEVIEKKLQVMKMEYISISKKLYQDYLKFNKPVTVFMFYSFDKTVKVEYDTRDEHVRVYRSTKKQPGHKDYELINLNFSNVKPISEEAAGNDLPSSRQEGVSGTPSGEAESGQLLEGKDRSQDLPPVQEDRTEDNQVEFKQATGESYEGKEGSLFPEDMESDESKSESFHFKSK